jgi:hypothetical protein
MPQTPGSGTLFPTDFDNFTLPTPVNYMDLISHSGEHDDINLAVMAMQQKLGIGANYASLNAVFVGLGTRVTGWTTTPTFDSLTLNSGLTILSGGIQDVGDVAISGALSATGLVTLSDYAAHNLLIAQGGSALVGLAPGTSGLPLVSQGASADPAYAALTVPGGGTGLTAATAHNLLVGNGTSALTLLAPGTLGVPLVSQGASSDPAYGTAVVAGGGTGLTSTTAFTLLAGGTTSTSALQSLTAGTSGQILRSNGAAALPTWITSSGSSLPDPVTVTHGGSGLSTLTAYGVLVAGTTSTGSFQQVSGTGTSGQVLTSNGASALPTWQAAGVTAALPGCAVSNSADIAATSGASTLLTFNTESFDTDSMHSTVSNTSRITFNTAGVYSVGAMITWTASGAGSYRQLSLRLNGTTTIGLVQIPPVTGGTLATAMQLERTLKFAATDFIEFFGQQDSGGSLSMLTSNFSLLAHATFQSA